MKLMKKLKNKIFQEKYSFYVFFFFIVSEILNRESITALAHRTLRILIIVMDIVVNITLICFWSNHSFIHFVKCKSSVYIKQ